MKNMILKAATAVSVAMIFFGICGADSDSLIPAIMMWAGMAWLALFQYANRREIK